MTIKIENLNFDILQTFFNEGLIFVSKTLVNNGIDKIIGCAYPILEPVNKIFTYPILEPINNTIICTYPILEPINKITCTKFILGPVCLILICFIFTGILSPLVYASSANSTLEGQKENGVYPELTKDLIALQSWREHYGPATATPICDAKNGLDVRKIKELKESHESTDIANPHLELTWANTTKVWAASHDSRWLGNASNDLKVKPEAFPLTPEDLANLRLRVADRFEKICLGMSPEQLKAYCSICDSVKHK